MTKKYIMHVLSGTHWDREWRYTAEQSKLRLADLIDSLITLMENNPEYSYFHLDGGIIVLEDYVSVHPEMEQRLARLIQKGRILLVPWYTLPDMFIVMPECIIRNLLMGHRIIEPHGKAMKSGYTATSYGQTSQLPQIYQGFGIANIFFYRGTNKYALPSCFLWQAPDGSRIRVFRCFDVVTRTNWFFFVHQPLCLGKKPCDLAYTFQSSELPVHLADEDSYELDFQVLEEDPSFNRDPAVLRKVLQSIFKQASTQSLGPHLLALNMEDNQKPYPMLTQMIKALNTVSENVKIIQNTIDRYAKEVEESLPDDSLDVREGEMRHPAIEPGFNGLLGAVLSSRVNLKILNEWAETQMVFLAEPLASIASIFGWSYPTNNLIRAWKSLLANHAHDSICGAAVDQAHKDMLYRFSETQMVAEEVTRRSLEAIWKQIDTRDIGKESLTLTIFNTLPFSRKEVAFAVVDVPENLNIQHFDLFDSKGEQVSFEMLVKESIQMRVERELDTSVTFPATRYRLLIEAEVPGMGYATYILKPRQPIYVKYPKLGSERVLIATPDGILENEYLKVLIHENGRFDLTDKQNGRIYSGLHYFTDSGEVGTAHQSYGPLRNFTVTSIGCKANLTLLESNPLRGVYQVDLVMRIPAAATPDGKDRLRQTVDLPISFCITLRKGSRCVKIKTSLENKARDHKLRVMFPTGIQTDYSFAESAFAIEKRSLLWEETGDNMESYFAFKPMQNFVDTSNGKCGLAFLNKGMREYEVLDDASRTLAITLLRTHRAYMTANEVMTPEELDKYTGSHVFGKLQFQYALYPHQGNWQEGAVLRQAYCHKVPLKIIQGVANKGVLPALGRFFEIEPAEKLIFSALKQTEDEKGILMRFWNSTEEALQARIKTSLPFTSVKKVRLDETPGEDLELKKGELILPVKKGEIVSIIFETNLPAKG